MSEKPLLLLDIDGAICPLYASAQIEDGYRTLLLNHEEVLIGSKTGARLAYLAGFYQLVWCSQWEEAANEWLAPLLGLDPLEVIEFGHRPQKSSHSSYKLASVQHFLRSRACAWFDDEIGSDMKEWSRKRPEPTLLLPAHPGLGLTEQATTQLANWSQNLSLA